MAYNYEYPYFDTGNFNSDWLINKMKELEETVIGLETFKYIGENEILDLNQQKQNSIAAFTSNFNVLNAPISGVKRVTVTYGSQNAYLQQLYDLDNLMVYSRIFTLLSGWTTWKTTQDAPGRTLHSTYSILTGSMNTIDNNQVSLVNGSTVSDTPTSSWGFVITWKSIESNSKVQLWFNIDNSFCYVRFFTASWSPWVELNHIDLTPYVKALNVIETSTSLSSIPMNSTAKVLPGTPSMPANNNSQLLTLGSPNAPTDIFQIVFEGNSGDIWTRPNPASGWHNTTRNFRVMHRSDSTIDANSVTGGSFFSGHFTNPFDTFMYVQGVGGDREEDQYQLITTYDGHLYTRFSSNGAWIRLVEFQPKASTRSLTITSAAEDHSTDDEGQDRYTMGDNLYTEAANTMYNTYISLPGQSLLHSDEGKQSFKDAILAADLSDTDVIMTNLEMWDMDIPLDTIAEEVAALSDAITAKNPMCELTLLSIPPIDIPLWGDEFLDYTMPNGSSVRQVDDRLFRLSEEHAFTYVSFEYFYRSQNANLMECLGDDFKTNKQYLRRVGSFIKNTM